LITVARSYIRVAAAAPSESDLTEYGEAAFDAAESAGEQLLARDARGTRVEVSPGSIETAAWIVGAPTAVIAAIVAYGSFWDALATIRGHARVAGRFIERRLRSKAAEAGNRVLSTRVTTRQLSALERLHRQVAEKTMSPDDAASKALRILRMSEDGADLAMIRAIEDAFGARALGVKRLEAESRVLSSDSRALSRASALEVVQDRDHRPRRKLVIERPPGSDSVKRTFE
jgi:hypothetical protein